MEDIKVGDYIRAKYGIITQIKTIKDTVVLTNEFIDIYHRYNEGIIEKRDIIKHSPNIIDLIEVGDYVNGVEVKDIDDEWVTMSDTKIPILKSIANGLIKSIVTKEMFSSVEYRVENN